jgi:tetratricopeptide (TPR) repeat protein
MGPLRQIATILAVALVSSQAMAQNDDALGRARAHFEAGRALYNLGNYPEAQREFAAGYELAPRPQFLINLGNCFRRMDDLPQAREMYQRYLREARADDPLRGQAEQVLAEVERELAARPPAPEPKPAPKPTPETKPVLVDQAAPSAGSARPAGAVASPLLVTRHPEADKPFIKRHWWIIPASVVVVGVGVGLGVYYGTRTDSCHSGQLTCWDLSK